MAAVPNTDTFSLNDVISVVSPSSNDLSECFNDANNNYFDSTYSGSKNNLLNFRNYDTAYQTNWIGYILWGFSYDDGSNLYFTAQNVSNDRDGLTSTLYWQTYYGGNPVDNGSVYSGTLDGGQSDLNLSSAFSGNPYDRIDAYVSGGPVVQIY